VSPEIASADFWKKHLFALYWSIQCIRGFTKMRCTNLLLTTYLLCVPIENIWDHPWLYGLYLNVAYYSSAKIKRRHSIKCKLTPATRSPSGFNWNMFLHFVTLWPWPLTVWPNIKWVSSTHPCGKFGDCSFSRFGSIVRTNSKQTYRPSGPQTHTETDVDKRFTPATLVCVSNETLNIKTNTFNLTL